MRSQLRPTRVQSFEDLIHRVERAGRPIGPHDCGLQKSVVKSSPLFLTKTFVCQALELVRNILEYEFLALVRPAVKLLECTEALLTIENEISLIDLLNEEDSAIGSPDRDDSMNRSICGRFQTKLRWKPAVSIVSSDIPNEGMTMSPRPSRRTSPSTSKSVPEYVTGSGAGSGSSRSSTSSASSSIGSSPSTGSVSADIVMPTTLETRLLQRQRCSQPRGAFVKTRYRGMARPCWPPRRIWNPRSGNARRRYRRSTPKASPTSSSRTPDRVELAGGRKVFVAQGPPRPASTRHSRRARCCITVFRSTQTGPPRKRFPGH